MLKGGRESMVNVVQDDKGIRWK